MQLDIKGFCLFVKEALLYEAIKFTKEHVLITREDVEVILHSGKPVLCDGGEPWVKKEGGSFDITMGAYHFILLPLNPSALWRLGGMVV